MQRSILEEGICAELGSRRDEDRGGEFWHLLEDIMWAEAVHMLQYRLYRAYVCYIWEFLACQKSGLKFYTKCNVNN